MRNNKIDDPFSALVYCHNLNVSRNASVNTMLYFLEKSDGSFGSLSLLTKREESVLRFLCEGSSVKTLLERYSITMKTFSMHKRNGLRKLGIKNTVMFYSLLQAWSEKWSVIFPETTGDGFKCDQRGEGTVLPNV